MAPTVGELEDEQILKEYIALMEENKTRPKFPGVPRVEYPMELMVEEMRRTLREQREAKNRATMGANYSSSAKVKADASQAIKDNKKAKEAQAWRERKERVEAEKLAAQKAKQERKDKQNAKEAKAARIKAEKQLGGFNIGEAPLTKKEVKAVEKAEEEKENTALGSEMGEKIAGLKVVE